MASEETRLDNCAQYWSGSATACVPHQCICGAAVEGTARCSRFELSEVGWLNVATHSHINDLIQIALNAAVKVTSRLEPRVLFATMASAMTE